MADKDDVKQAIIDNAASGIKRAQGDQGSMEAHDLQDQIAADKYLANKSGATKAHRGIRLTKLVPPGAV